MAILGPTDLPLVLKVQSDPIKKYVLTKLGYPAVDVELTEDQFETILKTSGDFIAGYFPREQRLAVFQTRPLVSTYPMPADAYWIQEIQWDPVTTSVSDIFGAESYLFCFGPEIKILAADGSLQQLGNWSKNWKAKTPYGNRKLKIKQHSNKKLLPKLKIEYNNGSLQATCNHVIATPGTQKWGLGHNWLELQELKDGQNLVGLQSNPEIISVIGYESTDAISVRAQGAGCYYACLDGEPILTH